MSIQVDSSLNPSYGGHPTILSTLSNPSPECSVYLYYTLPPLLFVDVHELALRSDHYTVLGLRGRGSRELEKPVHALPLYDEPVELLTRLTPSNHTSREVQLPIHVRYAEPLGEDLTLPFDSPLAFSSCDYSNDEGMQDPWALVTRCLDLGAPNKRLEIHVPVGDRQG
ncbi:hypothetical protein BKA70DRAFT_1344333, partial [Coprinopsis sp. MPI-PUGE-AT-0042]